MGRRRNPDSASRGPSRIPWSTCAALTTALVLGVAPGVARAAVGASGIGDPLFPLAGNGGYDVQRYSLGLDFRPGRDALRGVATIDATASEGLDRFDLDFREPLRARSVLVDGLPAQFNQSFRELVVTPAAPIAAGASFEVVVRYGGHPLPVLDPDGSIEGWLPTQDGALAPGEPQGAPSWFPCNDHPSDKALFQISATVPANLKAVSNGLLVSDSRSGGRRTFVWQSAQPMTTYLATLAIGHFQLIHSTVDGLPAWTATVPGEARSASLHLRRLGRVLGFYSSLFGAYPFSSTGFIFTGTRLATYGALETQTRPMFFHDPSPLTFVHEFAHQWFGDAVSPTRWSDIWLNEGFAEFSQWLWKEHNGRRSVASIFRFYYRHYARNSRFWNPPPARPGKARNLFGYSIYFRGGMTLQALRVKIGDPAFFSTLRDWVAQHLYGNGSVPEFIALAERKSGQDLGHFFHVWLYEKGRPTSW